MAGLAPAAACLLLAATYGLEALAPAPAGPRGHQVRLRMPAALGSTMPDMQQDTRPDPAEKKTPARKGKWYWPLIRIPILVYLGLTLALFLFQGCLVYHPAKEIQATPEDYGLPYEDVRLETSDGVRIAGWYVPGAGSGPAGKQAPPAQPRGVVLFFHGNAGNISGRIGTIMTVHEIGLDTLIIDYRGYGQSEGRPGEEGTYRDAEAAWEYLVEHRGIQPSRIVIHGRSLGGAVAAYLAEKHKPKALVLESAFTSVPDVGADIYPWLPVRWLTRIHYDTAKRIKNIRCPVFVLHSREDDIIPYKHGQKLFELANQPKEFFEMIGGHNNGLDTAEYQKAIREYLWRMLPPDTATTTPTTAPTTRDTTPRE